MANINRNFGKLTGGELTYAPRSLVIDDSTDLTAEEGLNLYNFTEISADTFVASRLLVAAYTA